MTIFIAKKENNNYFDCLPCLNVSHHFIPKLFYVV